jgi:hypothetical protein
VEVDQSLEEVHSPLGELLGVRLLVSRTALVSAAGDRPDGSVDAKLSADRVYIVRHVLHCRAVRRFAVWSACQRAAAAAS